MSQTLQQIKEQLSGAALRVSWWGCQKVAGSGEKELAADALEAESSVLTLSKKLLDTKHPAWAQAVKLRCLIKAEWNFNTFPFVWTGQRLFQKARRAEIWGMVDGWKRKCEEVANGLDEAREELIDGAQRTMGKAFDRTLYPKSWKGEFDVEIREFSIDPPAYLERDDSEEYKRHLQRTLQDVDRSMRTFEQTCWTEMGQAAGRLLSNLQDGNRIMGSNVEKFGTLFSRVAQMRFEGTRAFQSAMDEAQNVLNGVTPEELRSSTGLRQETRERLEKLVARYKQLQENIAKKNSPK